MDEISLLDGIVIVILTATIARGLFIGLIREGFSIAALGGAFIAVRYATTPVSSWLQELTRGELGSTAAPLITGTLIALATIAAAGFVSRGFKLGARAAGLGWADRLGGGIIGALEGTLVAGLLIAVATWALGHDSDFLESSTSVKIFDRLQSYAQEQGHELPDVASPAEWLSD